MRRHVAASQATWQRHLRSTRGLRVFVDEQPGPCSVRGGILRVQKTLLRHGVTLEHGPFVAKETVHVCAAGCRKDGAKVTRRARALAARIPPKAVVGYDVVFVGLQPFVEHRQREQIRGALETQHGIVLSTGEISHLCRRFLAYLDALHDARAGTLRAALAADGGWPLHIDATGEDGRGTLLVAFAGWRRWVLGAWKIPTERAETILPKLTAVVDKFGAPCAIMRDLGRAMKEAADDLVAARGQPLPVLACIELTLDGSITIPADMVNHARSAPLASGVAWSTLTGFASTRTASPITTSGSISSHNGATVCRGPRLPELLTSTH